MTENEASLTVAQMSFATGVPAHTLRYYEREGLFRRVARNSGNQRRYSPADVEWVKFLLRLRETGMPIAQMRGYAALRERGPVTAGSRLRLLEAHQVGLRAQIALLLAHEAALAKKIVTYQDDLVALHGQRENGTKDD